VLQQPRLAGGPQERERLRAEVRAVAGRHGERWSPAVKTGGVPDGGTGRTHGDDGRLGRRRREAFDSGPERGSMDEISLGVPRPIVESLPDPEGDAAQDMMRAVEGIESRINRAVAEAEDEAEAAGYVVDVLERLEDHLERYDEFVPELRAWGQSPIYAIAWRNLQADLIGQLYEVDWLADHLDRERNARLVEDGIRFGKR
jgi:hypothetical protein